MKKYLAFALFGVLLITYKLSLHADDSSSDTPLHKAVIYSSIPNLVKLLKEGSSVNAKNPNNGNTALHEATKFGWLRDRIYVELLLLGHADVSIKNKEGSTPLHLLALYGPGKAAQILLDAGANIEIKDKQGRTPLHRAAKEGNKEIAFVLLKAKAKTNVCDNQDKTPIDYFYNSLGKEETEKLLQSVSANNSGKPALHLAAEKGNTIKLGQLISDHADVNYQDKDGNTALHHAAQAYEPAIVELLLKAGANVTAQNNLKRTPLHEVLQPTTQEFSSQLRTSQKLNSNILLIPLLLKSGAIIDAQDVDERTPLHCAALTKDLFNAKLLLQAGADIHIKDKYGLTPLDYFHIAFNKNEVEKLLCDNMRPPQKTDTVNRAQDSHYEQVKYATSPTSDKTKQTKSEQASNNTSLIISSKNEEPYQKTIEATKPFSILDFYINNINFIMAVGLMAVTADFAMQFYHAQDSNHC